MRGSIIIAIKTNTITNTKIRVGAHHGIVSVSTADPNIPSRISVTNVKKPNLIYKYKNFLSEMILSFDNAFLQIFPELTYKS